MEILTDLGLGVLDGPNRKSVNPLQCRLPNQAMHSRGASDGVATLLGKKALLLRRFE